MIVLSFSFGVVCGVCGTLLILLVIMAALSSKIRLW